MPAKAQQAQQSELKSLQSEIDSLDKKINSNEAKMGSEKNKLQAIEQEIGSTQTQVDNLDNKIDDLTSKIMTLSKTVEDQKSQVEEHIASLENIMVKQYKDREVVLMKMMLNQTDPEDIDRLQQYYQYYSVSQAKTINKYRAEIDSYLQAKNELHAEQNELDTAKSTQAELIAKLEQQKTERKNNINALDNALTKDANALSNLQLDQQRLKKLIKELQYKAKQKEIAERKAAEAAKAQEMARIRAQLKARDEARALAQKQQAQAQARAQAQNQAQNQSNGLGANKQTAINQNNATNSQVRVPNQNTPSVGTTNSITSPPKVDNANIVVEADKPRAEPRTSNKGIGQQKGKLPYPLLGKVVATYGTPKTGSGLTWNGIMIQTTMGSKVNAVADGEIVYADWFRGYGQMVVIDHGQGYMTLYSHNSQILKGVGSQVRQNDEIARAGDSGGLKYAGLYFELRYNGQPVNPASWLR